MKITELRESMTFLDVEAVVVGIEEREVNTKAGEKILLQKTELSDDTGGITLTTWGTKYQKILEKGNKLKITGAYTKSWNGQLNLNISRAGGIVKIN